MHAYMPESVSFNELSPDDPKGNFDAAFAAMKLVSYISLLILVLLLNAFMFCCHLPQ